MTDDDVDGDSIATREDAKQPKNRINHRAP